MKNVKRIISIILLTVMAIAVVGCTESNNVSDEVKELAEYRTQTIAEVESYAESKGQDNYSEENWAQIQGICLAAIDEINNAENIITVDVLLVIIKREIDGVLRYEEQLIHESKMVLWWNSGEPWNFDSIRIKPYLGMYNHGADGIHAIVGIWQSGSGLAVPESETVAGYTFGYASMSYPIRVYVGSGIFISLTRAYELMVLTDTDIAEIYQKYNEYDPGDTEKFYER